MPGLGAVVATGILGTALGIVYIAGERSLAPVSVSHFLITAVIQPGILLAAFSGQMPRPRAAWWGEAALAAACNLAPLGSWLRRTDTASVLPDASRDQTLRAGGCSPFRAINRFLAAGEESAEAR